MYKFAAFVALALGMYMATVFYDAAGGGASGLIVGTLAFIVTGWVVHKAWTLTDESVTTSKSSRAADDRKPGESARDVTNRQLLDALVQGSRDWNQFVLDPDAQDPNFRKSHQTGEHRSPMYKPPEDCDILYLDGNVAMLVVPAGRTVVLRGSAGQVNVTGGEAFIQDGSRVTGSVAFTSGRLKILNGATIGGHLRIKPIIAPGTYQNKLVEHGDGYTFMPYGPGTQPFIAIQEAAIISGGIYGLDLQKPLLESL